MLPMISINKVHVISFRFISETKQKRIKHKYKYPAKQAQTRPFTIRVKKEERVSHCRYFKKRLLFLQSQETGVGSVQSPLV